MDYINKLLHRASSKSPTLRPSTPESGNDTAPQKSPEHAVKVQFAREFADVRTTTPSVRESLSSSSSFQSLSSALSVESPAKSANTSYVNSDIDGLDDLIAACSGIKLSDQGELVDLPAGVGDLSQDQTFSSAVTDLSTVGEDSEEESPKNNCQLNGTFEVAPASDLSKDPLVSVEESILKTHALDSVNKDSSVFRTAVEFQNLEESAHRIINEDKPNNSQNESIVQSDSSNSEFHFDASIDSVKNVSVDLISVNGSSQLPLERTQTPSFPLLPSISNVSTILEKNESVENAINSPNPVSEQRKKIPESFDLNSTTAIASEKSLAEDNLDSSNQEVEIKPGNITQVLDSVSPQVQKEDTKVPEEALNSTFPISPGKVDNILSDSNQCPGSKDRESLSGKSGIINQVRESVSPEISKEDTKVREEALNSTFPISLEKVDNILNDLNQCSEPEKSESLSESSIPRSVLEKVSAQLENIPQSFDLNSTTSIAVEKNPTEKKLDSSIQEAKIKPEIIPQVLESVSPHIPEEDTKVPEEASNSTFSISPNKVENIISDSNQCSEPKKSVNVLKSPIPQSILEKVAAQQKSLDAISLVDEEESNVILEKNSPLVETPSEKPPQASHLPLVSAPKLETLNSTVTLTPEKNPEVRKIVTKTGENFNTPELLSENKEIEISPSPDIAFLQPRSLNSTVISSTGNCTQAIPEIKVTSPGKNFEDTLRNHSSQSDSSNSTVKSVAEETIVGVRRNDPQSEIPQTETPKRPSGKDKINGLVKEIKGDIETFKKLGLDNTTEEATSPRELDSTVILEDSEIDLEAPELPVVADSIPEDNYETFKPQQQSTDLNFGDPSLFAQVEFEAQAIAKEIYDKSLELVDENEQFISASGELFQDPTSFDFLLTQESSNSRGQDLRFQSLYAKFDPLVNESMLPQGNSQPEVKEQNGKNELPAVPSVDTPKRNPAIAAIDRLLFYSPMTPGNKTEETKDMKQEASENSPQESVPVVDETMAKELALVRSVVMQLEEKLEKLEKDREEDNKKHEEQVKKLEEKNSRLESQLAQEIESKKQVTVVLDEYERSISRLVAEKERDRADLDERNRMKEELQAASQHLSNTEAAFNDVHQKYERLKGVVAAYKSNETVLKESVQENVETIKALENRYEQLKSHAMAQLEKANHELETIRKQNESEAVKLQAMLRKAELKSKSLADLVEQKTKENKELTQILDEVIARVGQNPE